MITFFEYYSSKLATSLCSDVDIELNGNVMAAVLRQGHAFSLQSIFHVYISMTYNAPMKPRTRVKAVRLITPSALTNFTFSWTSKVRLCVLCCYFNIYLALWLLFTHCTLVVCASFVHQLPKTIYSHLVQSILCDVLMVLTFPSSTYYM